MTNSWPSSPNCDGNVWDVGMKLALEFCFSRSHSRQLALPPIQEVLLGACAFLCQEEQREEGLREYKKWGACVSFQCLATSPARDRRPGCQVGNSREVTLDYKLWEQHCQWLRCLCTVSRLVKVLVFDNHKIHVVSEGRRKELQWHRSCCHNPWHKNVKLHPQ